MAEVDVRPSLPYRLPGVGRDGIMRREAGGLARLVHHGEEAAVVHALPLSGAVRLRAVAPSAEAAAHGIERMRFALSLDHDLGAFHRRFARDRLLGPAIRRRRWLRPPRHADPFQALAWAITEQLIESERAAGIQRLLTRRYGRRSDCGRLRDAPSAAILAGRAPAELTACDLAPKRALALRRAAKEVAAGRIDLDQHEPAWRRLRAIPEIGSWTVEKLALEGQGRDDQLPAGDLAYVKLVGRIERLGRPASEQEVRDFFAPYAPFQALAGLYLLTARHSLGLPPLRSRPPGPRRSPLASGPGW